MKDLGEVSNVLGMKVTVTSETVELDISYESIRKYRLSKCNGRRKNLWLKSVLHKMQC